MPVKPLARRATSPTRGRHLLSTERIEKGNLIFCERPLVALQSTGNVHSGVLVCHYCMSFCGSPDQALQIAADPTRLEGIATTDSDPRQQDGEHALIPCRHKCGQVYCSLECQQDDWEWGGHKELCTGCIEDLEHPLIQFRYHAVQSNEIFLLIAKWLARIHNQKIPYVEDDTTQDVHPLIDFSMKLWWEVAILPMVDDPMAFADMVALEKSCKTLCEESHALLKAAWPEYKDSKWLTPTGFARLIGSLEQNCIGVRRKHAIRRNIMEDKELREKYHSQIIKCLGKAGMIGGEEEECSVGDQSGEAKEDVSEDERDQEEYEVFQTAAEPTEWDYSPDEIADFLSNLSFPLNIGSDDEWDEIFTPLDGTAHFGFTEKMNHSCEPNSVVLYKSRGWGKNHPLVAYCVALKDIQPNEELTISYIEIDEPYEQRQESLKNYGFQCTCPRCLREKTVIGGSVEGKAPQHLDVTEKIEYNNNVENIFGSEDDDENSEGDEQSCADDLPSLDGDSKLRSVAEKMESIWNKSTNNATIPIRYLSKVNAFVVHMISSIEKDPVKMDHPHVHDFLQKCVNGITERDFSLCRIVGPDLEDRLYRTLQRIGSFESVQAREAYWCACCTAAVGYAQEGSFLLALQYLDKAAVLGLSRQHTGDFFAYVELFASQIGRTPCPHAVHCKIADYSDDSLLDSIQNIGLSAPIRYPTPETSIVLGEQSSCKLPHGSEPLLIRGLAKSWPALSKWRDMESFSHSYGHRLVPVEVGSMRNDMEEKLMSIREFITKYMSTSSKRSHWGISDAINPDSRLAYLAQHPLLEQIRELCDDVDRNPCGVDPTNINAWIGTGGTRTPLHFDSYDNLLVQIVGVKYVRLYHPTEASKLYVSKDRKFGLQGNMSDLECELEDYESHPLAKDAEYSEAILRPGDCLYIPSRYWHYVRSLSTSASINYWF